MNDRNFKTEQLTVITKKNKDWTVFAVGNDEMVTYYAKKNDNDISLFDLGSQSMSINEVDEEFMENVFDDYDVENQVGIYEKGISLVAEMQEQVTMSFI